jgi:hypothetical protein
VTFLLGRSRAASELAPLEIDLRRRTIAGIDGTTTRDRIEQQLGPPTQFWARRRGVLHYDQVGLMIQLDDQRVACGFSVFFDGVREHYRFHNVEGEPSEAKVIAMLGAPTGREVDDEEIMLEWRRDPMFLGIDYSLAGVLVDLFVDFR